MPGPVHILPKISLNNYEFIKRKTTEKIDEFYIFYIYYWILSILLYYISLYYTREGGNRRQNATSEMYVQVYIIPNCIGYAVSVCKKYLIGDVCYKFIRELTGKLKHSNRNIVLESD